MLEKPPIPDALIQDRLRAEFGLSCARLAFLPLGYDANTAVYRAEDGERAYFLKLRKGSFDPIAVLLPRFLLRRGVRAVMAPLTARSGRLWGCLEPYRMLLYPFVQGVDGYEAGLSAEQWRVFGAALRGLHEARLPVGLSRRLAVEDFSGAYRQELRGLLRLAGREEFADPAARSTAALMREQGGAIARLLETAGRLAEELRGRGLPFVPCHTDIHPGNVLLTPDGALYLVDWDQPALAPKERDLMAIGGGLGARWSSAEEIEQFYRGYGPAQVDPAALAYYRCERIIVDLVEFGRNLLLTTEGGQDREQSYRFFAGNFLPGHEIESAFQAMSEWGG